MDHLASSRKNHDSHKEADVPILAPQESNHWIPRASRNLKYIFPLRVLAFILIELGFIAFASLSLVKPIPLHLSPSISLTEARGALSVISIIWHSLAVYAIKDVLLHIFSAEWMEQFRRRGKLIPNKTDIVSRMTAGYIDQIAHFASGRATVPFYLAFISTLLLIALNGLGPSAITVNSIVIQYPMKIQIANLTMTRALTSNEANAILIDRANLVTRLEQLESGSYGFQAQQDNILIPWPSFELITNNQTIHYQSDVISYNYSCSWNVPFANISGANFQINNQNWFPYVEGIDFFSTGFQDAAILPLEVDDENAPEGLVRIPLTGFIFVGSNTTLSPYVLNLNLEDVPTVFTPQPNPMDFEGAVDPVLVTVLLCDPQIEILPATVMYSSATLRADVHSGEPMVKNVPVEAANAIFSQSLLYAGSTREVWGDGQAFVNSIMRNLFLTDPSFNYNDGPSGTKPLTIPDINQRMNKVLKSSSKAYLSGYRPELNLTLSSFEKIDTDAVGEHEQLAIVSSIQFLMTLSAITGVLVLLMVGIVIVAKVDQLQTFDLDNVVRVLRLD